MFDFGISELGLIAVVALIVLGPEKLPKAARMAGMMVRKLRGSWNSLRYELEREIAAEEMKQALREVSRSVTDASPTKVIDEVVDEAKSIADEVRRTDQDER